MKVVEANMRKSEFRSGKKREKTDSSREEFLKNRTQINLEH